MNDYDFSRLNDKEFEVLCTDLIGAYEGVRYERFKAGRDGGVDGRYFSPNGGEWILQAKHRPASSFSKLVAHVRSSEAPKVAALRPERYVLVVSHPLSRSTKDELIEALGASCPVSVYGREDLNDLLAEHPAIERRHFKLWISSSTVLLGLLNNAINGRSHAMMRDIVEKSRLFVQTRSFDSAIKRLNQLGTVIITGQAGIGKTTLAEQLILLYTSEEFELTCISEHIHEAEQVYLPDQKQLFYFDDFLGRNYLEALSGHEGSQIVNFIKRVARDRATKKFVLTSRTTIINQGRILNDVFEHNNIHRNEMEIKLDSLSGLDKAHILYNHIWHSGLLSEYIDEFYAHKRYLKVINHRNFNPRLIQFITDPQRLDDVPATEYWDYTQDLLENPAKVWAHPFDAQLDDFGRFLVLLVAFNGQKISEQDIAAAYAKGLLMPGHASFVGKRDFHHAIRHLSNSLITRLIISDKVYYKLFNPSLGDFLLHRYSRLADSLETLFKCLRNLNALNVLLDMSENRLIDHDTKRELLISLLEHEEGLNFKGCGTVYLAKLYLSASTACPTIRVTNIPTASEESIQRLKRITYVVLTSPVTPKYLNCLTLIKKSVELEIITLEELLPFTLKVIDFGVGIAELPTLGELVFKLGFEGFDEASEPFCNFAHSFMCDALDELFEEDEVFTNGDDYSAARKQLEHLIQEKFYSWEIAPTDAMVDEVVDAFDIIERMRNHFETDDDEHYVSPQAAQNTLELMSIDDLFSRDR